MGNGLNDDNIDLGGDTQTQTVGVTNNTTIPPQSTGNGNILDGFGFITSNSGAAYTNKAMSGIEKAIKDLISAGKDIDLFMNVFDNTIYTSLRYSAIALTGLYKKQAFVYIVTLESTGDRRPQTASEAMNSVYELARPQQGGVRGVDQSNYTADQAFDVVLTDLVIKSVSAAPDAPKNSGDYVVVGGAVVPFDTDTDLVARNLVIDAANAIFSSSRIDSGEKKDINIAEIKQQDNSDLSITVSHGRQNVLNGVSKPISAEFLVEVNRNPRSTQAASLNVKQEQVNLTKVTGIIDAMPIPVTLPANNGMPNSSVTVTRYRPQIIITGINALIPTPNFYLLALVSSLVMTQRPAYIDNLYKASNDSKDLGALNILANLENNPSGIGAIGDLHDKKRKPEDVMNIIAQMFTGDPIVSLDVESFGYASAFAAYFTAAASSTDSKNRDGARQFIINSASRLTNGEFPADFDKNAIFAGPGVTMPGGWLQDNSGVKDLRTINFAAVAKRTADPTKLYEWNLTSAGRGYPYNNISLQPYDGRVKIIADLAPDAVIHNKIIRVTFSSAFITTLVNSIVRAGLSMKYNPMNTYMENLSMNNIVDFYSQAALSQDSSYANMFATPGTGYATYNNNAYTNLGNNRY